MKTLPLVMALLAGTWSEPVHVLHEMQPVVTYRGQIAGDWLVIEASLAPGWKTFAIDNERRADERRAGKPSLGIDQPTQLTPGPSLAVTGPWHQLPPKDFSKPQLRWFTFGYQDRAVFAAKVRRTGKGPYPVEIRGQACTDTTCKNIDVTVQAPAAEAGAFDRKGLEPVTGKS